MRGRVRVHFQICTAEIHSVVPTYVHYVQLVASKEQHCEALQSCQCMDFLILLALLQLNAHRLQSGRSVVRQRCISVVLCR